MARVMRPAALAAALACLLVSACVTTGETPAGGGPDAALTKAVEPSLRAAAANAEAANDYKGAAQHWRTLYQRHPEDKALAINLARSLRYAGAAQQAADIVQAHLGRSGRDGDLLAELGKDYLAADRMGLARKTLEEAAALAPQRWDVHSALGVVHDSQGRYAEAQAAYGRALELMPDEPSVLNNLGLSQALSGKLDDAVASLRLAAEHPRAQAQVRQNLALLLALKGDTAGAERLARKDLPPEMVRTNAEIFRELARRRQ